MISQVKPRANQPVLPAIHFDKNVRLLSHTIQKRVFLPIENTAIWSVHPPFHGSLWFLVGILICLVVMFDEGSTIEHAANAPC